MKKINLNLNRISLILFFCCLIGINCSSTSTTTNSQTKNKANTANKNTFQTTNKNNNSIGMAYRFHNNNSFNNQLGAGIGLSSFFKLGKKIAKSNKSKKHLSKKQKPTNFFDTQLTEHQQGEAKRMAKKFVTTKEEKERDPPNYNMINQYAEDAKVSFEGWAKINSDMYSDTLTNPDITLRSYQKIKVPLSADKFRVNEFHTETKYGDKNYPPSRLEFYFRLSKKNLYYSSFRDSLKVLDTISFTEITEVGINTLNPDLSECIEITKGDGRKWNMCVPDAKLRLDWLCKLNLQLGIDQAECHKIAVDAINTQPITHDTKVMEPIILIPSPAKNCNDGWTYEQQGSDWECECSDGKEQSPIDLPRVGGPGGAVKSKVLPLFRYKETDMKETNSKIEYKENVIQLNNDGFGEVVTLDGIAYQAEKIVWHTPSEHTIDGKSFGMEMQIVHTSQMKGSMHKKFILNILFEVYPGIFNKFIEGLDFFNLPSPSTPEHELKSKLLIDDIFFDMEKEEHRSLQNLDYYTYSGSVSAPPCDQHTINLVTATPVLIGSTTVRLFEEALKIPDMVDQQGNVIVGQTGQFKNNRKTQPLNARKVYYYESKKPQESVVVRKVEAGPKKEGHYEKYTKPYTSYYFVDGDKPSNMPGAFLTSKAEAEGTAKRA